MKQFSKSKADSLLSICDALEITPEQLLTGKGIDIGIYTKDFENEYISLTDIAKYRNDNDPRFVIQNWM